MRAAVEPSDLQGSVLDAAKRAAVQAAGGHCYALLVGYNPRSGMFEYECVHPDGSTQVICVQLVMECFVGVAIEGEREQAAAA